MQKRSAPVPDLEATAVTRRQPQTVAEAYLALLAGRGVPYLFGNAGTDFAPMIEAYAEAAERGTSVPRPLAAGHENVAVTMAHGYAMVSRRIPAVMVHVSVGTANMVCAAMNAARENVPLLLSAGRSPITESGMAGSRDGYMHWAQEVYDQAAMIREFVKWDYELRNGEQLATVVDRALAVAGSEPCGPVYLSLPRETLAAPMPGGGALQPAKLGRAAPPAPDDNAVEAAAELLIAAEHPLLITANAGRQPGAFTALAAFAERFAIPVVQHKPRYLSLPSSHPMNLGYDPARHVGRSDVIMALETDVPWIPKHGEPPSECRVIQCGFDPLYGHIPIRGFPGAVSITSSTAGALGALTRAMDGRVSEQALRDRRRRVHDEAARLNEERAALRKASATDQPLSMAWVSHCIDRAKPADAIVVNEYTLQLDHCSFEEPDSYFGSSSASGLGWGAGAALGAKLAAPDRPVIAVVGDGAYMFSNPVAVHHAAALHELPVLFVVMNNARWHAVHRSTMAMYPQGRAAASGAAPFIELGPLPAFEQVCAAAGGYGERVETPDGLAPALQRALKCIQDERRQALLNVICAA